MVSRRSDLPDTLGVEFQRLLSSSSVAARTSPTSPVSSNKTSVTEPSHPSIITLDVAGSFFKVSADVLIASSGLFRRQLSARFNWTPQRVGTYFVDADPELFKHLLRFMRRPSVFPLFWSKDQGFDYDLYHHLEAEAEHFQVGDLHRWIRNKMYLNAVIIRTDQPWARQLSNIPSYMMSGNSSEEWHYVRQAQKVHNTYVCPRGIPEHIKNSDGCGKACKKALGDDDTENVHLEVVRVRQVIVFDEKVCQRG